MDYPLLVRHVAERAETVFPSREVVSFTTDGVERSSYGEVAERARRLASSLERLGVKPGDRVATFAWNSVRHLKLYLAVPSMGAVLHALNIRLFPEQLIYVANHAEDKVVFVDASLAGLMPHVRGGRARGADAGCRRRPRRRPRLRAADRGRRSGLRLQYRRAQRRGHVLHERHHGQAQGRGLLAPLHAAPLARGRPRRLDGDQQHGLGHAGRADVPRQRVGDPLHGRARRRPAGLSGTAHDAAGPHRPDRCGESDLDGGGADDLAGSAPARAATRSLVRAPGDGRRIGRARAPDPRLPGSLRRTGGAGLGDDRDEPARLDVPCARRGGAER